jgi:hypothetical protein
MKYLVLDYDGLSEELTSDVFDSETDMEEGETMEDVWESYQTNNNNTIFVELTEKNKENLRTMIETLKGLV